MDGLSCICNAWCLCSMATFVIDSTLKHHSNYCSSCTLGQAPKSYCDVQGTAKGTATKTQEAVWYTPFVLVPDTDSTISNQDNWGCNIILRLQHSICPVATQGGIGCEGQAAPSPQKTSLKTGNVVKQSASWPTTHGSPLRQ